MYTHDAAPAGTSNWQCFFCALSTGETLKKISTSGVCLLLHVCNEKVSSEEKKNVFGKSTLDSACNGSRSVCLRREQSCCWHLQTPNVLIICFAMRELVLDRLAEIENGIKQVFTNDGLSKLWKQGQRPEANVNYY